MESIKKNTLTHVSSTALKQLHCARLTFFHYFLHPSINYLEQAVYVPAHTTDSALVTRYHLHPLRLQLLLLFYFYCRFSSSFVDTPLQ